MNSSTPQPELGPLAFLVLQRAWVERVILAVVLPGVAGAVNASGFLAVGRYTSHVTGQVARIGDELAQGRSRSAAGALAVVGVFMSGAIAATILIERAKRLARARYVAPLVLQATVLAAFAIWAGLLPDMSHFGLTALLCFAMGLQNALVTKISGAVIRTTHVTGIVTDIGIEIVRLAGWLRERLREQLSLAHGARVGRLLVLGPEWKRLRLHVVIFASFLCGAILGPYMFLTYGQRAMVGPCVILLVLAAFDYALGIQGTGEPRFPGNEAREPEPVTLTSNAKEGPDR